MSNPTEAVLGVVRNLRDAGLVQAGMAKKVELNARRMEIYERGLTDLQSAALAGMETGSWRQWRKRHGLASNKTRGRLQRTFHVRNRSRMSHHTLFG